MRRQPCLYDQNVGNTRSHRCQDNMPLGFGRLFFCIKPKVVSRVTAVNQALPLRTPES